MPERFSATTHRETGNFRKSKRHDEGGKEMINIA